MFAATTPIVRVQNMSKRFVIRKDKSIKERLTNFRRSAEHKEEFWALRDVDLEIAAGSTVGLIGPNGSGKSTLLKMIGGIIQPTFGSVQRRGQMAPLLELGAGFHPDLTGRENVYLNASILGLSRRQTEERFDEIVEFSGIGDFIDSQVKFYSSGMYVRLAFAVAINVNPDLLLVDEVLAVGDEAFQKKCLDKIRSFQREGRTIVLVTHTLSQITDLCTRAVVLAKGNVVFDGDPIDAVSILRSGFATSAAKEEAAHASTNVPHAEGPIEVGAVTQIRVCDSEGNSRSMFRTGDDIVIEVEVSSSDIVPAWGLGLHIDTPLGQLVTGATTGSLDLDPAEPLHGKATGRFVLPDAQIGPGEYRVTVALVGSERQELDRMEHGAKFAVERNPRHWGPLSTDIRFEMAKSASLG
jgi:ABC-2 type transport system ATP-binding protein